MRRNHDGRAQQGDPYRRCPFALWSGGCTDQNEQEIAAPNAGGNGNQEGDNSSDGAHGCHFNSAD